MVELTAFCLYAIGLTITRMLVSSDRRICQLFNIHGGSNLLMALLQNASSAQLKAAVSSTLTTVNNGGLQNTF